MTKSNAKRIRFRFGLRSLLIVFVLSSLAIGYVITRLQLTNRETAAINKLQAMGAEIQALPVHAFDENNELISEHVQFKGIWKFTTAPPPMPKFLWPVLGKEGFSGMARLRVAGPEYLEPKLDLSCKQLSVFSQVHDLKLLDCKLESLEFLGELPNLTRLYLFNCELRTLDGIEKCKSLKKFEVYDCDQLMNMDALAKLPNLEQIYYRRAWYDPAKQKASSDEKKVPPDAQFIAKCKSLKGVYIHGDMSKATRPEQLNQLDKLEWLSISELDGFTDFSQLAGLKNIKSIKVRGSLLTDLASLTSLPPLETLHINDCRNIGNFEGLWSQMGIKELNLQHCSHLGDRMQNISNRGDDWSHSPRETRTLLVNSLVDESFDSMAALKKALEID